MMNIEVDPDHQRQGIATGMWEHAHSVASRPLVHSALRTDDGDAWARSVGGRMPGRVDDEHYQAPALSRASYPLVCPDCGPDKRGRHGVGHAF